MDTEKNNNVTITSFHIDRSDITENAHLANNEDHDITKWNAIKQNPKCFWWCLFGVWITLLVSYENQASGNVLGIPQFRKDFGTYVKGNYEIDPTWQAAFSGGPLATTAVGALCAGVFADWIGRKYTLMAMLALSYVAITLEMVAVTVETFFGAKMLNGIVVGVLAAAGTTYVGEISPLALRGLMTCLLALAYTIGPFVCAVILNFTGTVESRWAYRAIFASQYGFLAVATVVIPFMPESPWWLATKDKDVQALRSLTKLGYSSVGEAEKRLAVIKTTLDQVKQETEGVTYVECFRKSNLRRTIIAIAPLSIQALGGVLFIAAYSTYYQQLAGYSTEESFRLFIALQVLSVVGNVCSWELVDRVGRRRLTFWGSFVLTILLMVVGSLATVGTESCTKGAVGLMILYGFIYNASIGSTAYNLLTEVATSRLRIKTIAIGLAVQMCWYVMWSFTLPYLFNPSALNLGAKISYIFGGLSVLCTIYLWFYQPETAMRSYEELDEMFMKRIPARKFKGYVTEVETKSRAAARRQSVDNSL